MDLPFNVFSYVNWLIVYQKCEIVLKIDMYLNKCLKLEWDQWLIFDVVNALGNLFIICKW